jgi:hypothetical protein
MTFSSVTAKRRNGSANVKGPDVSRQSKRLDRRYLDPVTLGIFYTLSFEFIGLVSGSYAAPGNVIAFFSSRGSSAVSAMIAMQG